MSQSPRHHSDTVVALGGGATEPRSGAGMDRRLQRRRPKWLWPAVAVGAVIAVAALTWLFRPTTASVRQVAEGRVTIATVEQGVFDDFIPVRGRVTPARTVFLDAVEGGRVESVHREDGAVVDPGDLIAVLSNSQLQLDVIAREAAVEEQLNNLRTIELNLERNRLDHKRNLVEIDYQITRLSRIVARRAELAERGNVSQADLDAAKDELAYFGRRREVTIEARDTDELLSKAQIEQLRASSTRLQANLELARGNLDALNIRAPIAGTLTALNAEIGQSLSRGERIGQVDSPDAFKIEARVDEFYIDRVAPGLLAEIRMGDALHELRVGKIYPQIADGQFVADLLFNGDGPDDLRRGQTLQTRLFLGDPQPALLLPHAAFLQNTGGNWAFVVEPDGRSAVRRDIRTGRRNANVVEVLDGLNAGDRVVVSSYQSYQGVERLEIAS